MEDEDEEAVTVEVLSTCIVVPEVVAGRNSCAEELFRERHLFLPGSDSYWRWVPYNGRLLFYDKKMKENSKDRGGDEEQVEEELTWDKAVAALKEALARALWEYYPFAGRLSMSQGSTYKDGRRLEILCDGQGVPFIEARTQARFETIAQDAFQIRGLFHALAPPPPPPPPHHDDHHHHQIADVPLLAVQVTRLLEGEIVIGCIHSHVLGDGSSFWNFMVAWAGHANGAAGAAPQVVPVHDRRLLDFRDYYATSDCEKPSSLDICWSPHSEDVAKEPLLTRVFHLSEEMLLEIKAAANSNSIEQGDLSTMSVREKEYTRYETLCAHVWRYVVDARCLADETKVGLVVLADVRRRMEPNIPEGYVGNAVIARTAMATKGELLGETIRDTCARIRETISNITDSSIKKEMACLEGIARAQLAMWGKSFVCLNVVSSPRFPIFHVDFGWGPPCAARPVSVGMFGRHHVMFAHNRGALVLFPAKDGGIDLCITLQHGPMHKLVMNTCFSTLVKG